VTRCDAVTPRETGESRSLVTILVTRLLHRDRETGRSLNITSGQSGAFPHVALKPGHPNTPRCSASDTTAGGSCGGRSAVEGLGRLAPPSHRVAGSEVSCSFEHQGGGTT
jgi:hypothetical protein